MLIVGHSCKVKDALDSVNVSEDRRGSHKNENGRLKVQGGMGCSAGVVAIDLAHQLMRVRCCTCLPGLVYLSSKVLKLPCSFTAAPATSGHQAHCEDQACVCLRNSLAFALYFTNNILSSMEACSAHISMAW